MKIVIAGENLSPREAQIINAIIDLRLTIDRSAAALDESPVPEIHAAQATQAWADLTFHDLEIDVRWDE